MTATLTPPPPPSETAGPPASSGPNRFVTSVLEDLGKRASQVIVAGLVALVALTPVGIVGYRLYRHHQLNSALAELAEHRNGSADGYSPEEIQRARDLAGQLPGNRDAQRTLLGAELADGTAWAAVAVADGLLNSAGDTPEPGVYHDRGLAKELLALGGRGSCHDARLDFEAALRDHNRLLAEPDRHPNAAPLTPRAVASTFNHLGAMAFCEGDRSSAVAAYEQALAWAADADLAFNDPKLYLGALDPSRRDELWLETEPGREQAVACVRSLDEAQLSSFAAIYYGCVATG